MHVERIRTNAPAITLPEVKAHMRVDDDFDDAEIAALTSAATLEVEEYAGIAITSQTVRVTLHGWGEDTHLSLPIGPVADSATVTTTLDGEAFTDFTFTTGKHPAITVAELTDGLQDGVVIVEYPAGYSTTPDDLRLAIADQALQLYDLRAGHEFKRHQPSMSPHAVRVAQRYRGVSV